MRRFLLTLIFITTSVWSQPAQQQAQPPILVKVEMPQTPQRDFLGYLQGLGPLIAALVAVGVALMQRHLLKEQLKQNLYEKRWKVYQELMGHIEHALQEEGGNIDRLSISIDTVQLITENAQFLFGPEVMVVILDVTLTLLSMEKNDLLIQEYKQSHPEFQQTSPTPSIPEYNTIITKQQHNLATLRRLRSSSHNVIQPYLQLHHWKNPVKRLIDRASKWMESNSQMFDSRYDKKSQGTPE